MSVIKQETILSVFGDDKVTLLEWIKKVYKTLDDGALTAISVNRIDAGHIEIIFTFADGTTQSSGPIVLGAIDLATLSSLIEGTSGEIDIATNVGGTALKLSIDSDVMNVINNALVLPQNAPAERKVVTINTSNEEELKDYNTHDGNLNVAGNLTGNSIIENMDGYSVTTTTKENIEIDYIYCGVVKNGNKLTLTAFVRFNRTGDVANNYIADLVRFNIPSSVGAKIYPTSYSGSGVTELVGFGKVISSSAYDTFVENPIIWRKISNTDLRLNIYSLNSFALNTPYIARFELTLLLSDNLAG